MNSHDRDLARRWMSGILLSLLFAFWPWGSTTSAQDLGTRPNFRVALTGKYPPFSMYDAEGHLIGFDVDVSKAIARRIGHSLTLIATEWDGILPGLLAGKYDAIIGSMAITEERRRKVDFSSPYYRSGAQLFIHKNHSKSITGIQDCTGKRIGVVLGETFEHFLRENHPAIETVTYKSTVDIFQDVENGRLIGFVSDRLLGAYQIQQEAKCFVSAGNLLYQEKMGIPVVKGRPLLAKIDNALADMRTDGELDSLFEKWFNLKGEASEFRAKAPRMKMTTAARMLGNGFAVTMIVALASITTGFLLSVPGGLILNSKRSPGHTLLRTFNDFIRGTPVLIQLFFFYFGLCGWINKCLGVNVSATAAAIFTLSINASAYMAEVVRSGLMSVNPGQEEAARALGLNRRQVFCQVVWPQAFRIALPPLMNSVVALIKDTALVSVITVPEVIRQAQSIISVTFNPVKYYLITAVMFFVVTFPLMKLAGRLERQIREKGFSND